MEDWSSRRHSAMNRARELRSKITELRDGIGGDASSIVSSTMDHRELQRQRRSRQLAETQRLLEQFADVEAADVTSSVKSSSIRSDNVYVSSSKTQMIPTNESRFETRIPLGRGRGRGRSGSGGESNAMSALASSSSRHVGSLLQSDNLNNLNKPFLRDTAELSYDRRSKKDDNTQRQQQQCYYLRDHRVPEEKEGECDKLVVLRQRLAARRRVRERELDGVGRDEQQPITSIELPMQGLGISTQHRVKENGIVSHDDHHHEKDYSVGMFEHKDDESSRSYRSNNPTRQMNVSNTESSSDSIVSEKSVVDIELIQCDTCGRSFAPKIYEKHFDTDGQPKCSKQARRRPKFDSAKNRIANNSNLNSDEQMQALKMNKKVVKQMKKKKSGSGKGTAIRRSSKWREESRAFREAMKASRYC